MSVIIPAYKQAHFLGEAIRSVLAQTYRNFEIIIVNDASPDDTDTVVGQFNDSRIKYIIHETNRRLPATRNTGIKASSGDIIMFLDSDDIFHEQKIFSHVEYMNQNPDVGLTYNPRFELNYSGNGIRELVRPPLTVDLSNFVLGYPFTPSDTVVRREWIFKANLFDESLINGGEDLDLPARLLLAGCKFASVDRALNYRRHHPGYHRKNLEDRLEEILKVLEMIFSDPRCPDAVVSLRDRAYMNNYLVYAYNAFTSGKSSLGQSYLREAIRLVPDILVGKPCPLARFFMAISIADDTLDHHKRLKEILGQIPSEASPVSADYDWMVGYGYLLKGVRSIIWSNSGNHQDFLGRAFEAGAKIDRKVLQELASLLTDYETEFGTEATQPLLERFKECFRKTNNKKTSRRLNACLSANRAFSCYNAGEYSKVPGKILRAFANDPKYLANRGMLSVLLRSILATFTEIRP